MLDSIPLGELLHSDIIIKLMKPKKKIFKIIVLAEEDVGVHTIINKMITSATTFLPTTFPGLSISLTDEGDNLAVIYTKYNRDMIDVSESEFYKNTDAAIGIFDLSSPHSFKIMKEQFSKLVSNVGKFVPLIIIGNKADLREISTTSVRTVDVLEYAYEIGDCVCHRVPYLEISALQNFGFEKVISDLVKICGCDFTQKCATTPAILRHWCQMSQFYSYYDEIFNIK